MSTKKGVFTLRILSAQADVPGAVSAVGQACHGKFYFAFSPRTGAGILVLSPKKGDPTVWRTTKGEAPHKAPDQAMAPKEIVEAYNAVRSVAPVERGEPAWYRGAWAGTLACNDGAPVVTLTRKVASYALLSIVSTPSGHWKVTATTRPDKWFTSTKRDAQTREEVVKGPLSEAMEHGYRLASASVAVACSTRDTTRRTALDAEFAKAHPAKPVKAPKVPKKDPIEEVAKRKAAPEHGWLKVLHDDDVPEVKEATPSKEARALLRLAKFKLDPEAGSFFGITTERWHEYPKGSLFFREDGDDIEWAIRLAPAGVPMSVEPKRKTSAGSSRDASTSRRKAVKAVDLPQLPAPKGQAAATKAAAQLVADAKALGEGKGVALETMMIRAAKLVALADSLVRSDACTGDSAVQANAALKKAKSAFDRAAAAAEPDDGVRRNLAAVAQQAALVAARAGKACAGTAKPANVPRVRNEPPGLAAFMAVYDEELARAVREHPTDYSFGPSEAAGVAAKMRKAIASGTYNKDGRGFAQTCKRLGIPNTYKAIAAYIAEAHAAPAPAAPKRRASQAKTPTGLDAGKQQKLGSLFADAIRQASLEMSA